MTGQPVKSVLIVDDEPGMLMALRTNFQREGWLVDVAAGGTEALRKFKLQRFPLVVTDVRMPDLSGIDLLRRLKESKITVPVIVITGHGDVALAVEAMKIGAVDFLEKPFDDKVLLASVEAALRQHGGQARRDSERAEIDSRLAALSPRERDVLGGLVAGHANKQIAFDLGISPRTVEIYRANLMNKMQAGSLSDLVRMALVVGILGSE